MLSCCHRASSRSRPRFQDVMRRIRHDPKARGTNPPSTILSVLAAKNMLSKVKKPPKTSKTVMRRQ